jgi:hypothetical protein
MNLKRSITHPIKTQTIAEIANLIAIVFLCMCTGSVLSITSFFKASLPGYKRKNPNVIIAKPNFTENLKWNF